MRSFSYLGGFMIAFISEIIAKEFADKTKIETIPLSQYNCLDSRLSSHADMLLSVIDDKLFIPFSYYEKNKTSIDRVLDYGYEIITVDDFKSKEYPYDISLNVLVLDKCLISYTKHTSKEIINYCTSEGYKIVNVKQGYTACSTLKIDENTVITADKSINDAVLSLGKQSFLCEDLGIKLDGYNCGFIGGSSCVVNDTVVFFGHPATNDAFTNLKNHLEKINKQVIYLDGELHDYGGAKILGNCKK